MDRLHLDIRKKIEWIRTVPQAIPVTKRGIEERLYRVPRELSVGSKSLYEMVLERGEMSPAEAQMISDEHSLLFRSIWSYWYKADSRLIILDSMRYSSFLSWIIFICFIVPIWIAEYLKNCDLVSRVVRSFKRSEKWEC